MLKPSRSDFGRYWEIQRVRSGTNLPPGGYDLTFLHRVSSSRCESDFQDFQWFRDGGVPDAAPSAGAQSEGRQNAVFGDPPTQTFYGSR
jgi:hypothetical protein